MEDPNPTFNFSDVKSLERFAAVINEYKRLVSLPELTDEDEKRLAAILAFAVYDKDLEAMLSQIDKDVAEELENND
jgi:K+/H+ antiporter YhaU regulatory subunit KhtT